jgi:hypothetical protein
MDYLVKEAIEIRLHPKNLKRDGGFTVDWSWNPMLQTLQQ